MIRGVKLHVDEEGRAREEWSRERRTARGRGMERTGRRDKERKKESEKRTDRRKVERLFMRLSRVWSRVLDLRGGWTSG